MTTSHKFILNELTGTYSVHGQLTQQDILQMSFSIAEKELLSRRQFTTATDAEDYIRSYLMGLDIEVFGVMFLTTKHDLISTDIMFKGTIDSASVYPREIVKKALNVAAKSLIVFHNHPSGNPEPSRADINITQKLQSAMSLFDLNLLDHFVVSKGGAVSLAQRGLM